MSPATPAPPSRPVAISLDVGGVLVVPDHGMIGLALRQAGIEHDRSCFGEGHYRAMVAVDHAASHPEDLTDYLWEFLEAVGVATSQADAAHELLLGVVTTPFWCQPVPGSRTGLRALADAGLRLAVTSNSDGTVADHLRRHEWVQVGEGPGVSVEVITDSGIVGVGKPDPRVFAGTVDALGLTASEILHVGDSVHYDVEGATACGLQAAHMDPYRLCDSEAHAHVRSLDDVAALVAT